jgi:hypothetical protein
MLQQSGVYRHAAASWAYMLGLYWSFKQGKQLHLIQALERFWLAVLVVFVLLLCVVLFSKRWHIDCSNS